LAAHCAAWPDKKSSKNAKARLVIASLELPGAWTWGMEIYAHLLVVTNSR